jgi:hypothetical protein
MKAEVSEVVQGLSACLVLGDHPLRTSQVTERGDRAGTKGEGDG